MKLSDYNYLLPQDQIAHFPPKVRGQARLLVLDRQTGQIEHRSYSDIPDYLNPGDVLILNDTKVIRARLIGKNKDGKSVEIFLLEKHSQASSKETNVIYRGKLQEGETIAIGNTNIVIRKINPDGTAIITSDTDPDTLSDQQGSVPLPPYMKREATEDDTLRYQTIFAKHRGSVAAPTASLNMTQELLETIATKGVTIAYLTLHVGLGTFAPIKSDDLSNHHMHSEYFSIPAETISAIRNAKQQGRAVVALGTTVTRALEYAHADVLDSPLIVASRGEANIFIYPGYSFRVVDRLITNFHAPKSTVLMLTAAFAGWNHLEHAYQAAIQDDYRFLSYGDSMLIK